MSEIRVTTLKDTAGSNSSTAAEIYSGRAKAWVNFNGTGTVAIRNDYNVNTISDRGTGSFTVNFSSSLGSANYAAVAECNSDSFSVVVGTSLCKSNVSPADAAPTASAYQCSATFTFSGGEARFDPTYGFLAFFE